MKTSLLRTWSQRIDGLSLRERALVFATGFVVLWAVADTLWIAPAARQVAAREAELAELGARLGAAQQALQAKLRQPDPLVEARSRRDALRRELDRRLEALAELRGRLLTARDMPRVLQELAVQKERVRLVALKSLEPEPIAARQGDTALYYRHGVQLTVEGDYLGLVGYLRSLERTPVLWGSAELSATEHPRLRLELVLYTLSEDATWLQI